MDKHFCSFHYIVLSVAMNLSLEWLQVVQIVTSLGSCFRNQFAGLRLVSPTSGCPFKSPFTTGRTYLRSILILLSPSLKIRKILAIDSLLTKWIPFIVWQATSG
ncbi:hypothetical protein HZH68_006098 [Vespula germanica]|uniref:Uncharacterized protein n=1 Tax=Vespula germanica TaxID=30212 RepID=A0A834KEE4_VESGE|nr:hypothetical protein HZH68_006098 [Vespula germanica]